MLKFSDNEKYFNILDLITVYCKNLLITSRFILVVVRYRNVRNNALITCNYFIFVKHSPSEMLLLEPLARYNLSCIAELYTLDLSNGQYLFSRSSMKINKRGVALPLVRRQTEETKLKISKANKGKRLGCAPWNKGKKLHYIPGKREHSEQTLRKMSESAKRRWSSMYT